MQGDQVSRYVEDFGCDSDRASDRARGKFKDIGLDHYLELCKKVNGLVVSPEERQVKKEER